jgi:O-antigen biosynthesis protein
MIPSTDRTWQDTPTAVSSGKEFSPLQMIEVELTEPLPAVVSDRRHQRVWVLGRLYTEPVGACIIPKNEQGLSPDQLGALLWPKLREPVMARFAAAGLRRPAELTGKGLAGDSAAWPFLHRRAEVLDTAPFISVVICTRDRPDNLAACLRHLNRQEYPRFEVVVVDNAPKSNVVRPLVESWPGPATYRYVAEPRAGLSWARNAGTAAASGHVIAFLDDDEEPDSYWLAELARGFARGGDIGCVTGMILPARLDTQAQDCFEQFGGHSKGRGFSSALFSKHGPQNPLYPSPPFGAGGNMAFRREVLTKIGGFDVSLGAGTPARAGEDTLALTLTLLAGYRIAYQPAAFVRHNHYEHFDGLGRQLHGYGVGLTAYYTALLCHRPSLLPSVLRLAFTAARYLRGTNADLAGESYYLPARLRRRHRSGIIIGPAAYFRSAYKQARAAYSDIPQ